MAGFVQARTLSQRNDDPERASRPFDVDRDGFVLGEGAGIMVLERAEFAAARGATVHGALAGAGLTSDAYHITGPEPEGIGQSRAIAAAVRDAGLEPSDVGHVNCHATSTVAGDVGETRAVRKALGDHPVLTAPKSALGHLVGAAGAVESIITLLSIKEGDHPGHAEPREPGPGRRARRGGRRAAQDGPDRRGVRLVRLRRPQRGRRLHQGLTLSSAQQR